MRSFLDDFERSPIKMKNLRGIHGLWPYLRRRGGTLTGLLLLSVFLSFVSMLPAQAVGCLVDLAGGSPVAGGKWFLARLCHNEPTRAAIAFGIFYMAESLLSQGYGYFVSLFTEKLIHDVRSDLFRWVIGGECDISQKDISGDLLARCSQDVEEIRRVVAGPLNGLLTNLLKLGFSLLILAWWNGKIAFISMIIVPTIYGLSIWISRVNKRLAVRERSVAGGMNNTLADVLANMPLLKTYGAEKEEIQGMERISREIYLCRKKNLFYFNLYWPSVYLLNGTGFVLTFLCLLGEIRNGTCSSGDILVAYTYLTGMYSSMISISRFATDIFKADASLVRVFERKTYGTLGKKSEDAGKQSIEKMAMESAAVEFYRVTAGYGDGREDRLENVSFSVQPGELLVIMGRSGSGKSTVINTLAGFTRITEGYVKIAGKVYRERVERTPQRVRICFQKPYLFHRTLKENLQYGSQAEGSVALISETLAEDSRASGERMRDGKNLGTEFFDTVIRLTGIRKLIWEKGELYRLDN